jgi:hypothetical protein
MSDSLDNEMLGLMRRIVLRSHDDLAQRLDAFGAFDPDDVPIPPIKARQPKRTGRCPACGGLVEFPCRLCALRGE